MSIVTTLSAVLEALAVLIVGLALRLAVFVAVLAAVATPVVIGALGARFILRARRRALGLSLVAGLPWRSGLLHTAGHLWIRPERRGLRLGLDGLARKLLPDVRRVALPETGAAVRRGEPIAEVVTASRRVPIPAPLDGTVTGVNRRLRRDPGRLARDPYLAGWLVTLRPAVGGLRECLHGDLARRWFEGESGRLARLVESEMGVAAADGGEPLASLERAMKPEQWERLADRFFVAT